MNIEEMLESWGKAELRLLEHGGGFPKQTALEAWVQSPGQIPFGSRIPVGVNMHDLLTINVRIRGIVDDLPTRQKLAIWGLYVLTFKVPLIAELLSVLKTIVYSDLEKARAEIQRNLHVL